MSLLKLDLLKSFSDCGTEFLNTIVQELCAQLHISQAITSGYAPKTNGLCEKTNHILGRLIAKLAFELNDI